MSVHVTSLVWKLDCPATVKIVLLKLADHAKDDGSDVHPSQATVAKECGLTDRSVRSAVKAAIQTGWLVEEPSPGNRANRYRFDKDAMREGGKKFHQEPRSTRNHVPASRNHVPPRRNHVPPINKNRPLTVPEPSPPSPSRGTVRRPSEDELVSYAVSIGLPESEGHDCFNHYEMVGWVYGKGHQSIKDWKRAVVTWKTTWTKRQSAPFAVPDPYAGVPRAGAS